MSEAVTVGAPIPRFEDIRFVTGRGTYTADINLDRQLYACVLRSPHAFARIVHVDLSEARAQSGVAAILTATDLLAARLNNTVCTIPRRRPDGSQDYFRAHPGLAAEFVRYVGEPVALVVAESRSEAVTAAELIEVTYDSLPAHASTATATSSNAPRVWHDFPNNISNVAEFGDKATVESAFAAAPHIVRHRLAINRVIANPMEPRGVIGSYDRASDRYTLYTDTQTPHLIRDTHARIFGVEPSRVRVVAPDIGGGFGMKCSPYPEMRLCLLASRMTGRPVKWISERSEAFFADEHSRDNVADVKLAVDSNGQFLALRVDLVANLGAYLSTDLGLIASFVNLGSLAGVYRTPSIYVRVTAVYSNMTPITPYRGSGRPEAIYITEMSIDRAARQLGRDRVALRRANLISLDQMPFKTGLNYTYDSGDFAGNMQKLLEMCSYSQFEERRRSASSRKRLRGLGIINSIESAAAGPRPERVEVRVGPQGTVTLLTGTKDYGQGHQTMYRQILGSELGVRPDDIDVRDGDTDTVAFGTGTIRSRSAAFAGGAVRLAVGKLIEKGRRIAAHALEAHEKDIEYGNGKFTIAGTDRSLSFKSVAGLSYDSTRLPADIEPGFVATGTYVPKNTTFPNGSHACEVEIDPETGAIHLVGYWCVEDVGTVVNPVIVAGQLHGGIAQGAGQALMENIGYDESSGQLLTGSLMDYAIPRAGDFCSFEVAYNPTVTKANALGIKGVGEAGTVGGLAVVMSAVNDALGAVGAPSIDMPATSEKIWRSVCQSSSFRKDVPR